MVRTLMVLARLRRLLRSQSRSSLPDDWQHPFAQPSRTELPYFDEGFRDTNVGALWEGLGKYNEELKHLPARLFLNGFFGPGDVAFYYSIIREARPAHVVEIGSGYSTEVARLALKRNGKGSITCIDPAPRIRLAAFGVKHVRRRVEQVDSSIFEELQPGDILFIDSSHTAEEAMYHRRFLSKLPSGVHVHYHDIDYPWPRPEAGWDDDEIIHDFIREQQWRVRVFGSALTRDHLEEMWKVIPQYAETPYRRYNGLWLVSA